MNLTPRSAIESISDYNLMRKSNLQGIDHLESVSVLIGENGCGKSQMLFDIANLYLGRGGTVIAIANCLHDRFHINNKKFHFLGVRNGKNMFDDALIDASLKLYDHDSGYSILGNCLEYIGFEPTFGIRFDIDDQYPVNGDSAKRLLKNKGIDIDLIDSAFDQIKDNAGRALWVSLRNTDATLKSNRYLTYVMKFYRQLEEVKLINGVRFFFRKNGCPEIPFGSVSSGEATQISTSFFIASHIRNDAVILIDEPENSLHPRWQKGYVSHLLDLFYLYSPRLYLATHSPLIISTDTAVYHVNECEVKEIYSGNKNVERKLLEMFGVVSGESAFLSRHIANVLEQLKLRKKNLVDTLNIIASIRESLDSELHIKMMDEIEELAHTIEKESWK